MGYPTGISMPASDWQKEPLTADEETQVLAMLRTLRQVVQEFGPDYVYEMKLRESDSGVGTEEKCVYVYNDAPSCIAAQVLYRMGVTVEDLKNIEGQSIGLFATTEYLGIAERLGFKALRTLAQAQEMQDRLLPWGAAYEAAKSYAQLKFDLEVV
jgi:hypothetical protein